MNVTFGQATTPEQLAACMRLRYAVYTEEMNLYQSESAATAQMLTDDDDAWARIFYAEVDGEVVATSRAHLGSDGKFPDSWDAIWNLKRFAEHCDPKHFLVSSRTTVAKAFRGGPLTLQLFTYKLDQCVQAGSQLQFFDCVPHLVGYYQRLGGRVCAEPIEDADVGILVPMCIVLTDQSHLAKVRSPFLAISQKYLPAVDAPPAWVQALFHNGPYAEAARQQRLEQGVFDLLADQRLPLFDGLTPGQVLTLTQGATLLDIAPNHLMIKRETVYRSMFLVLFGSVDVIAGSERVATLYAGEVLGEMAYLLGGNRSASVAAGPEGVSLLNLQEGVLRKVFAADTAISATFHTNLARVLALRLAASSGKHLNGEAA